jgi:aarF domain-containing kinase
MDLNEIVRVCKKWGIRDAELFASSQIMKPFDAKNKKPIHLAQTTKEDLLRAQLRFKERVQMFLEDTKLIPNELIFIGRCLNLVRANNKAMGSPVNRVHILAEYAAKGSHSNQSMVQNLRWTFQLWILSFTYQCSVWWQRVNAFFGRKAAGFEDLLETSEKLAAERQLGFRLEVDES